MLPHDELYHYGVLGMRWGVRRQKLDGVSNRTYRDAQKDAEEYTRAKMFYGEGAGNRRKLIKATVEAKSKKDPAYKKAFDHHVNSTDFSKRAEQARSERKRKDVKKEVGKTARGIKNLIMGTGASVGMTAAVLYGGYQVWRTNPQVRSTVNRVANKSMKDIQRIYNAAKLKGMGF